MNRPRRSPAPRTARVALFALLASSIAGCDVGQDSARTSTRPSDTRPEATAPLVPGAPDFVLPEDWAEQHPTLSPNAKPEAHYLALAEASIERNPADGEGRVWLESSRAIDPPSDITTSRSDPRETDEGPRYEASSFHRFELGFEVGPRGIDEGGVLFVAPEAFWFWSEAQTTDPRAPGFTTAKPRADDVQLRPAPGGAAFVVEGRGLEAGERIDFVYGASPAGAQVDRYADRGAEIMFAVDADGDGFREWLDHGVRVEIVAGRGVHMVAFGPAEIGPGAEFVVQAAILDRVGNRARWPEATHTRENVSGGAFEVQVLEASTLGLADVQRRFEITSAFDAPKRLTLSPAPGEGTIRLRLEGRDALEGLAFDLPPIVVREGRTRLVWGDLHGHTGVSDGTGRPHDYFAYARDVAGIDVVALTDHDHWGARPLDEDPDTARRLYETAESFHAPGRFVTVPGYEWTNWLHGHRHVLYFESSALEGNAPIFSALDPATDRPDELWAALRGRKALTFAHHSAGEPVATNWTYLPDPVLEPLTEIASVHGTSEAADGPLVIRGAVPGNFARDLLIRGPRVGFIGSGDSHDGHPGLAQIASGQAGLAGIFVTSLDRPSLLDSMRRRHTFATNGIRPWLDVRLDATPMGSVLPAAPRTRDPGDDAIRDAGRDMANDPTDGASHRTQTLHVEYEGTAPIARVDLIRGGRVAQLDAASGLSYRLTREIPPLVRGEFHYVRIQQEDGGVAWSSPIFARDERDTKEAKALETSDSRGAVDSR